MRMIGIILLLTIAAVVAWVAAVTRVDEPSGARGTVAAAPATEPGTADVSAAPDPQPTVEPSRAIASADGQAPDSRALRPSTQKAARETAQSSGVDDRTHWSTTQRARSAARRKLTEARKTLAADPYHETALRDAIDACETLRDWTGAAEGYAALCDLRPRDRNASLGRVEALLRAGRMTAAAQALETHVERFADDTGAWRNLAALRQQQRHLSAAIRAWTEVLNRITPADGPDAESSAAEACVQRGIAYLDLRNYSAAAADFRRALELGDDAPDTRLNLALAQQRGGHYAEARAALDPLLDANPRHVPALLRLYSIEKEAAGLAPGPRAELRVEQTRQRLLRALPEGALRRRIEAELSS